MANYFNGIVLKVSDTMSRRGRPTHGKGQVMKKMIVWFTALFLLIVAAGTAAENVAGLPLHIAKLDPKVVRVWIGDYVSSTATVAIATDRGIVVIDTLGNPLIDAELRKIISRELGRTDFRYLINTHEHGDHTGGNSVYSDCTIVGHELVCEGMKASFSDRQGTIDWYTKRLPELQKEIDKEPTDSPARKRLSEDLAINRLQFEALKSDAGMVCPNMTFSDRMNLDLGDTTLELYYIGGMHSASDIAVFAPQHGLLFTGDTMADVWLTDTPGCLASFVARDGVRHDFPLLLRNWGLLLEKKDRINKLITGHWNGELTLKGFEDRVNYIGTLWEGVNKGLQEGKSFREIQAAYDMNKRFPELVKSPGCSLGNNYSTILEMWTASTGQGSAAKKLYELIEAGAGDDAVKQVMAEKDAAKPKYFFLEEQVNGYGYRFVQDNKLQKAIALFKLNVELFPQGWNTYDSLAETLLKTGDVKTAKELYEKSLQLNPESKSGKEALEKIRKGKAGKK
jgi:glyoxylase-like metal-dependent hydrolase (beta-lactamase superfamily II)